MEHNIYQAVEDLFPEDQVWLEGLNPTTLLNQIEARLITSDQLEFKRIQFEIAKQKESENLWEFENRLHYLQKQAKIDDETQFVETYKKGIFNNKLRERLMIRDPPITTRAELKAAVSNAQIGMLKFAKTFSNPPAAATAGLGSLQRDELETRRKTNREIAEALKRYRHRTTDGLKEETPMDLDAILRAEDEDEEGYDEESEEEADDALFFMEPNHDQIRAREESETQDYWEAGITTKTINILKQGNMDHSQKTCYHCNRKGHIKANCLARKRLDAKPWTKKPGFREKRTTTRKGY